MTCGAFFACSAPAPQRPAEPTAATHVVTLRGIGPDRISSVAVSSSGDAIIGITRWSRGGKMLIVSHDGGPVVSIDTPVPVATVAVDGSGRACYADYVEPRVRCIIRDGRTLAFAVTQAATISRLFRSGRTLLALDATKGRLYAIEPGGARPLQANVHVRGAAADGEIVALLGDHRLCIAHTALRDQASCRAFPFDAGDSPAMAVASRTVFVVDVSRRWVIAAPARGPFVRRPASPLAETIQPKDDYAIWLAADSDKELALQELSVDGTVRNVRLPLSLSAQSLLAAGPHGDLVIVDGHRRAVVFVSSPLHASRTGERQQRAKS